MGPIACNPMAPEMCYGYPMLRATARPAVALAMLVISQLLACAHSSGGPAGTCPTAAPVAALSKDPAEALAWLPAEYLSVGYQPRGQIALILYAQEKLGKRAPACLGQLAAEVDGLFQLSRRPGDHSVSAIHGLRDRDRAEQCIADVYEALTGQNVILARDMAVTRATTSRGAQYLVWSSDGWLYSHPERDRAQAMLARPSVSTLATPLRTMLAQFSLSDTPWVVCKGDMTSVYLGVPSTGVTIKVAPVAEQMGRAELTLTFDSEAIAQRALDTMRAAAEDRTLPEALRKALAELRPARRGLDVELDAAFLLRDSEAADAALAVMKERFGKR